MSNLSSINAHANNEIGSSIHKLNRQSSQAPAPPRTNVLTGAASTSYQLPVVWAG